MTHTQCIHNSANHQGAQPQRHQNPKTLVVRYTSFAKMQGNNGICKQNPTVSPSCNKGLREVKYPDYGNSKMRVLGNKQTIRKSFHAFTVNSQTKFGWKNKVPRNKFDRTTTTADTAECDKHHRDRNRLSLFFQAFSESGVDKFLLKPSGHHAIKSWHVIIKKKVVFLVLASTPCSFARKPKAEEGVQSIPASNITTSAS